MGDALRTYALVRQEGGRTSALEDALAADLRAAYQELHALAQAALTATRACGHHLGNELTGLTCTRPADHPGGCTYQSTSGVTGATKEEL